MTGTPALLGALGLVGILFALLNFILGLFGAGLDTFWIGANLFGGLVLLGSAIALNLDGLRERLRSGEARRAGKYGSSAVAATVLGIAVLGMLGFLATRYHTRLDWSEAKVHSLSDQSTKVLAGLEEDVEVLALFSAIDASPIRDLLDRYAYESDRFQVEFADPNERPDLLERYSIEPESLGNGLVRISLGEDSTIVQEVGEENITNAMVKLARTGQKRVYFLEGHNERAIDGEAAAGQDGYGRAADALRNENYEVEKLLLAAQGEVPSDADAVIIAGATRPLLQQERDALHRYLAGGGAVLALVDPRARTDLVDDLREWGVDVGDDIVVDRQLALFGRATTPFAGQYDNTHEITREMRDMTLFHVARSIRKGEGGGDFTEIVFTGESSWAERDLERFYGEGAAELGDDDVAGPVSIAVAGRPAIASPPTSNGNGEATDEAADEDAPEPRLVVFGDADFASNELIEAYRNRDLFLNTANWLLGDVEAISIRPARSRASRFQLSNEQFLRIRSLSLFVFPEAIAVLGVVVWWSRRQAPRSTPS